MTIEELQHLCERGQEELMRMDYLAAERTLEEAEQVAWSIQDWDTLARLYMPLQEARRQKRQRCGEGDVVLDLWAQSDLDHIDARHVVENFAHGQVLVAGWGTIEPAVKVRELARQHDLFLETFLGAVYPMGDARVVAIVPTDEVTLPPRGVTIDQLNSRLPVGSIVLTEQNVPKGSRRGTPETFGEVMAMWENLHRPFLTAADNEHDPLRKMQGYRKTIAVDYACELAHQKLSDVAKQLSRQTDPAPAAR
jgi:hypothetical protein